MSRQIWDVEISNRLTIELVLDVFQVYTWLRRQFSLSRLTRREFRDCDCEELFVRKCSFWMSQSVLIKYMLMHTECVSYLHVCLRQLSSATKYLRN